MEDSTVEPICQFCRAPITETNNFCPNCGANLKGASVSLSAGRKTYIYLFSFFLAPLGLGYAYKYLKQKDPKIKKVGYIVIAITILAIILMVWFTSAFTSWELRTLNEL